VGSDRQVRPLHKFNPVRLAYIKEEVCGQFGRDPKSPDAFKGCGFWTSAAAAAC
jgi:2-polyprenyl-3-methyl-5-hydroxy-6-metoxy-1,4-benzoquinol methylase